MTRLISLGLHRPSALQYLIDEGILQHEPKPGSYTWKSYSVPDQMVEEEVLWTKNYVAYSRDGYIQRIFNYTEKDDDVHDAVLTFFTSPACINEESHAGTTAQISADQDVEPRESGPFGRLRRKSRRSSIGPAPEEGAKRSNTSARTGQRALVILIGKQCHIHFLTGSTHVVSIPFQVSKVFPMREGIILQRNVASRPKSAGKVPAPPPNSFFSSQPQFSPFARSPLVPGKGIPNFLLFDSPSKRLSISSASANIGMDVDESDFPHFWSLTDPLSDFSAIASATVAPLPRHLRTDDAGMIVEYDDIDASETLIYVSQNDEFATGPSAGKVALMLFVTMNDDLDQVTIWQGWYLKPRSLSDLMAVRKAVQQLKEAGRSSVNTAATAGRMPGVRFHDKGRESFAATAELPKKKAAGRRKKSQPVAKSDAKEEEVDMALRMDPDFPSGRQPTKGPRRTGSLLSRGDLSTHDPTRGHSAVGGSHAASARRGPSMRMSQDRRSFGTSMYRKSRGSVPGSTFSRSLGPEDENSMDLDDDSFLEGELEAEITRVTELFLATHDFASVESTFAFGADGIKPELVLRKVHVLPLSTPRTSHQESGVDTRFKVHTLSQQAEINSQDGTITMWIHDKTLQRTLRANFDVVLAPIGEHATPPLNRVALMAIPLFRNQEIQSATADIAEVIDGPFRAVVSSTESGLLVAPQDSQPWLTSTPRSLRLHDSADVQNDLTLSHREVGLNRLVDLADSKFDLSTSVKPAHVYAEDSSGHKFDLEVKFRPRNQFVDRALQIARLVLHGKAKRSVLWLWASALIHVRAQKLAGDTEDVLEFEALAVFLLSYSVGSLGRATPKARRSHPNIPPLDGELLPQPDTQVERNVTSLTTTWQTLALGKATSNGSKPSRRISKGATVGVTSSPLERILFTDVEAKTRSLLLDLYSDGHTWLMDAADTQERVTTTLKLMLAMQLLREEIKLNPFEGKSSEEVSRLLAMCLCQLGHYLRRDSWDWKLGTQLAAEIAYTNYGFSDSEVVEAQKLIKARCPPPFSMNVWLQVALTQRRTEPLPDLMTIAALGSEHNAHGRSTSDQMLTLPRLTTLSKFLERISASSRETYQIVEIMQQTGMSEIFLATLPESTAGYLREYIAVCRVSPPSTWSSSLLRMVDREDLMLVVPSEAQLVRPGIHQRHVVSAASDLYALLSSTERPIPLSRSHEADRHAIIAQIFSEDRRFVDAARLTNSANLQVAECPPQPGYSDEEHLEQQKKVMQWVMIRTVALPAGSAMIHFESQKPLISEKFQVAGFSTICQMKPMDNTVSADKTGFTEEKLSWAFFHAGASAGLHISRKAAGIDTSWVVFNKPDDLTNRHAGFLLALGLNGHLRKMAKWLAFKYLTPKHTMTSIGLLLGLSASYMGTMDSLITRMLSVHITRMLPPGAAELNVSPLTQAVGLLGVGLLYYNTQHRRMSEIMLSELEHRDIEEAGSAADRLRDESYRLAAGFSLGVMNLGKGNNLQGLQGMGLLERLLSIAIGPRPVELVHVVDKATAGATVALAFIYMKTNDPTIARKIDIPDTVSQLDHIRPDILLLRTLAKNLIMWNDITATEGCIKSQLPSYASHYFSPKTSALLPLLPLRSSEIPLFNIITGHAWSLALKHAGTASLIARDEILAYLDVFWSTSLQPATYYDAQLARTTIRRCVDMLALSAATVMAGTGDVKTFRYLRRLHGRTDAETTYGSHMAAHLAVGTLFLGGGTYTFSTSDLAIAGLVMAFYPLWPQEVLDNAVHLQAFRHLWVLAAEARCVVCQDVDSGRPVQMDVRIRMRDGEEVVRKAPCLLPELESVASVETVERGWWKAKWDFERNVSHRRAFKEEQTLWVRRAPAKEENPGLFARALKRLNESGNMPDWWRIWAELLKLPAFECLEESELGLAIPANATSGVHEDAKGTVLDDRLVLLSDAKSWDPQRLWNIRLLLSWAERKRQENDGSLQWLGDEFVQRLTR
ncbi:Negative regulator of mitosis-like protein [Elsinoe fawcettii]|nr:Negative regulator of mitosis-like protein [Elsinoe fawcettii]